MGMHNQPMTTKKKRTAWTCRTCGAINVAPRCGCNPSGHPGVAVDIDQIVLVLPPRKGAK